MASFPFTAIVGQDDLKTALLIAAVDPQVGGVLAFGDRGTGKSTAIRSLAALLPTHQVVEGCPYQCNPSAPDAFCEYCREKAAAGALETKSQSAQVVDLPLGATEDRIVGALDLERALVHGEKRFQPGLLAQAHRGFLYIDEVNLLDDHLVDVLLDVAASGENVVERDGMSVRHPARFVLVGSGNPEEGELRPQLLDRFGLAVDVRTPTDIDSRMEIVRRRDAFDRNPDDFAASWNEAQRELRERLVAAQEKVSTVETPEPVLRKAAELCIALGADGLRGELTLIRAARAHAALAGRQVIAIEDLAAVAGPALRHRLRKDPLDETDAGVRVERAVGETLTA